MAQVAIRVERLGKRYRVRTATPAYRTLREDFTEWLRHPFQRRGPESDDSFWALRDVSFDVAQGEVLGVIGRNGAGKSTLLKLLARITRPTSGYADVFGHVGSLLEVGTGFHGELTGRENIALNGAILGMTRAEVRRRFDEIVAFAEIESFLDTPVKRYSTGMHMRLAFAVAAHLAPDILIVDEVLAVGDASFQEKCLGKMSEVARSGRTVLFVSHQLNAIETLCSRCLWLEAGQVREGGEPRHVIGKYLQGTAHRREWTNPGGVLQNRYFQPARLGVVDSDLQPIGRDLSADESFGLFVGGHITDLHPALTVGFAVFAAAGELLFWTLQSDAAPANWPRLVRGENQLVAWIPGHLLNEGEYRAELIVSLHFSEWVSQPGLNAPAIHFSVRGGLSQSPYWMTARPGLLAPHIRFETVAKRPGAA